MNYRKRLTGNRWLICLVAALFAVQLAAQTPSPITATLHQPDEAYPGVLLWHQSDELRYDVDNVTLLTDAEGNLLHQWETNLTGGGAPAYLLSTGGIVRLGITDKAYSRQGPVASSDTVQITDVSGRAIWELRAQDLGGLLFHHDIDVMPNGNLLICTYEPLSAEQASELGWDSGESDRIWVDGVIEVRPDIDAGSHDIVWHWRVADHIVQDRNSEAANYGVIAENPQRIDPHFPTNYAPMNIVRQHINSVDYNPALDQILLSSFIYNEIWIIDHSTTTEEAASSSGGRSGRGGDLLFRYGNPAAYGRGESADRLFLKQHDANWIDPGLPGAGNILVHNNNTVFKPPRPPAVGAGPNRPPQDPNRELLEAVEGRSNVYELILPLQADGNYTLEADQPFTAERVWFWDHENYFADFQGGARRLPNGNTLVSDTTDYLVVEVNPAGDIVAEYKGVAPVFKAFKYDRAYAAEVPKAQAKR